MQKDGCFPGIFVETSFMSLGPPCPPLHILVCSITHVDFPFKSQINPINYPLLDTHKPLFANVSNKS